jgi:hypothetical protein
MTIDDYGKAYAAFDAGLRPPSALIRGPDGHWRDYVQVLCRVLGACFDENDRRGRQMIREARADRRRWMRRHPRRRKPPLRAFYEPVDYLEDLPL